MNFELFSASHVVNGKAGIGLSLYFVDDHKRSSHREFGYALGEIDETSAGLHSVLYSMAAIHTRHQTLSKVMLCTDSAYARKMLSRADGKFSHAPDQYEPLVAELREWYERFRSISTYVAHASIQESSQAMELAKTAAQLQKNYDSGTASIGA